MNEVMCRAVWLAVDQDCIPSHTGAVSLGISSLLLSFSLLAFIIVIYLFYFIPPHTNAKPMFTRAFPEFIGCRLLAYTLGYSGVQLRPS